MLTLALVVMCEAALLKKTDMYPVLLSLCGATLRNTFNNESDDISRNRKLNTLREKDSRSI